MVETLEIPSGVAREPEDHTPARGPLGYGRDKLVDVAKSAIDVASTPATLMRDLAVDPADKRRYRAQMEAAADTKRGLDRAKTEYGQHEEETGNQNRGFVQGVAEGVIDTAPQLGLALAAGPLGAGVFGATAYAGNRAALDDRLRRMKPEERDKLRQPGESDDDMRERLYSQGHTGALIEGTANTIGGGAMQAATRSILRRGATDITDRILKRVGVEALEGGAAGGVMGGGSETGRQVTDIDAGLRPPGLDTNRIWEATKENAANLAAFGAVGGAFHRGPARAAPIDTDVTTVLADQLADKSKSSPPTAEPKPPAAPVPAPPEAPPKLPMPPGAVELPENLPPPLKPGSIFEPPKPNLEIGGPMRQPPPEVLPEAPAPGEVAPKPEAPKPEAPKTEVAAGAPAGEPIIKPPVEVTPPGNAPPAMEDVIRQKLGLKPRGDAVIHGPPAEPIIARERAARAERLTDAMGVVEEGLPDRAKAADEADRVAKRREDEVTAREQTAHEIYTKHAPGENEAGDIAGRQEKLQQSKPAEVVELVKEAIARAKTISSEYSARMLEMANKSRKHPVFNVFDPGADARAGKYAARYHRYMVELHNFVRNGEDAVRGKMFAKAKRLAEHYYDVELKMRKEGGPEQLAADAKARNELLATQRKTGKLGADDAQRAEIEAEAAVRMTGGRQSSVQEAETNLTKKPVRQKTETKLRQKFGTAPVGRDAHGRMQFATDGVTQDYFVGGVKKETDIYHANRILDAIHQAHRDAGHPERYKLNVLGEKLTDAQLIEAVKKVDKTVQTGTYKDILPSLRPTDPIKAAVFDHVLKLVGDHPVTIVSPEGMAAMAKYHGIDAIAFQSAESSGGFFRHDVMTRRVVFHEALHAATQRAIMTSPRLLNLTNKLINAVNRHYQNNADVWNHPNYTKAFRNNAHEFISELFTVPEVSEWLSKVKLTASEAESFRRQGYRVDEGRSILGTLWQNFLRAIGFNPETPNAYKVATDLVADMFGKEDWLQRNRDTLTGTRGLTDADIKNLKAMDPVRTNGFQAAIASGDTSTAASHLMDMAEHIARSENEKLADNVITYLKSVNEQEYGGPRWEPQAITPVSNSPAGVHNLALDFMRNHMGEAGKNLAFKIGKTGFGTEKSRLSLGFHSTFDLVKRGTRTFQEAARPLLDALAKRETFSRRYMDDSGANELLNRVASVKNAIKDRKLWTQFEQLLIKEGYHGAYVDEPLSHAKNSHIDPTKLLDEQTRQNHQALQDEWAALSKNEHLKKLREDLHAFGNKALDERIRAHVSDMVTRLGMVDHDNALGRAALVKRILRKSSTLTPAEAAEYTRLENAGGSAFHENMSDIRKTPEFKKVEGPYVPFLRHGKHAVYAEYHIKPADGVDAVPSDPDAALKNTYDFRQRGDAENFIRDQLNAQGITQTGGHEIVYDTRTGKRAKNYTDAEWAKVQEEDKEKPPAERRRLRDIPAKEVAAHEGDDAYKHYEIRHRVTFNPRELQFFENERLAQEHSDKLRANPLVKASGVETPHEQIGRANVAYTSAEMQRLMNRVEASQAYQHLSESQQAEWKRELKAESARVTMTAGRRSMFLPREYAKGASTDILRNYLDMTGSHARAMADLNHRGEIDRAFEGIAAHNNAYRYTKDAERLHGDVTDELRRRVHAPPTVDGPWAAGVRRALQVSMISHLADTGFLAMNATEPWVIHLPIISGRHGLISSATELARAYGVVSPAKMAQAAFKDIGHAAKNERIATNYEKMLLDGVTGQQDAPGLQKMFKSIFEKGLVSRDVGMEVERLHDLTSGKFGKAADYMDNLFRGANTGVETMNRAAIAISAYRLEMKRAARDGIKGEKAHDQAVRYAEDSIFRGAGDYASWNSPRYFNAPWAKLGLQFKKYPQRMIANYADAMMGALKGDTEKMKQLAWMMGVQSLAAGAMGLPLGPLSGSVNTAYMLGLTDNNWNDVELGFRKVLAQNFGPEAAEVLAHGALRLTGADIGSRLSQNSLIFFGSPDSRKGQDLLGTAGRMVLGAPGDMAAKFHDGIIKMAEANAAWQGGADREGWAKAIEATQGLVPVKVLTDMTQAYLKAAGGPATHTKSGIPLGNEYTTGQAIVRALGFTPSVEAERSEARRGIKREQTQYQQQRTAVVQRFVNAEPKERMAIWQDIQRHYNVDQTDPSMRINYGQLLQAANRTEKLTKTDNSKLGVPQTGRRKSFADIGGYFNTGL